MNRFKRHFHTKGTENGGDISGNNVPNELRNADQIRKGRKRRHQKEEERSRRRKRKRWPR